MLLIEFRNNQHELVYRNTTPTGLERGDPAFTVGVHETYAKARDHFEHRKDIRITGTWMDGVVERMRNLDRALDRLDHK